MRKIMALVLALVLLAIAPAMAEADHLARIQEKGVLMVATEGNWAPWTYHDESDELVGFDIEVAKAVAEKLGVEAKFTETAWSGIFAGMDAGRWDIIFNGVEATEDRAEKYDFSAPYGYMRTALIIKEGTEGIESFEDLAGKKTCNSLNSTYMDLAEQFGATAVGVETLDETLAMVASGRADATLNAEVSFYDYMAKQPDAPLKVVCLYDIASNVIAPMTKGEDNATLLEAVNQAIAELAAEGKLTEISMKYFGCDITAAPEA